MKILVTGGRGYADARFLNRAPARKPNTIVLVAFNSAKPEGEIGIVDGADHDAAFLVRVHS